MNVNARFPLAVATVIALSMWFMPAYSPLLSQSNSPKKPRLRVLPTDENGAGTQTVQVLRKITSTKVYLPLLTMVFFDKNSSEIPVRYNTDYAVYSENMFLDPVYLTKPPLYAYYQILNVIGARLQDKDNANEKIRLVGCTDGSEDVGLCRRRAEALRAYWKNNYGIDESRIVIEKSASPDGLPGENTKSKRIKDADKELIDEENRRVEIYGDWNIIHPIIVNKLDTIVTPPDLYFRFDFGVDSASLRNVELLVQQPPPDGGTTDVLLEKTYNVVSGFDRMYLWEINKPEYRNQQPKYETDMTAAITVTDDTDRSRTSDEVMIPVEQRDETKSIVKGRSDRVVEFDLILFDFGKDAVTDIHKRIIGIIKSQPSSGEGENPLYAFGAAVTVTGYSDNLGSAESNRTRSGARANAVSRYMAELFSDAKYFLPERVVARGAGISDLNHDRFATPESRMYCRTVRIRIDNSENQ